MWTGSMEGKDDHCPYSAGRQKGQDVFKSVITCPGTTGHGSPLPSPTPQPAAGTPSTGNTSSSFREHLSFPQGSPILPCPALPYPALPCPAVSLRCTLCHGHTPRLSQPLGLLVLLSLLSPHPNPPHFPHPSSESALAAELSPPVSLCAQLKQDCPSSGTGPKCSSPKNLKHWQ